MIRSEKEENKRRRTELWLLIPLGLFFILLNWALFRFNDTESGLPLSYALFFFGLVNLNALIFLLITFFLARNLVKLYADSKPRRFGKSLKARLFLAFVSFAFIPTTLMFLVSVFYINSSFDRWFANQTQTVLETSARLSTQYIDDIKTSLFYSANQLEKTLNLSRLEQSTLDERLKILGLDALEFYSSEPEDYKVSIYSEKSGYYLPKLEESDIEKKIKVKKSQSFSRKTEQGQWLSAMVHSDEGGRFLVVSKVLPFTLIETIDAVATSRREFQQTKAFRLPLKTTYYFILITMTLVILAFGGWFSLYLAQSLSKSIFAVGAATKRVSKGEFNLIRFKTGMTELNELIENFNSMTTELKTTRESLNHSMEELEQSSVYIKTVLSQVSSGVLSFDENYNLTYYNKRAKKIFSIPKPSLGKSIESVLPAQVVEMVKGFKSTEDEVLVQEMDIERAKEKALSLQISISRLLGPNSKAYGSLITVEEVDLLRENQRVKAWKEVATRVAHEIKNPLTPVKLSAERLMKKYAKDIDDPVFVDCIKTIIYHVDLIKNLVNEFNQFARFPQMKPVEVEVKSFFDDLLFSYKASHPKVRFKINIDPVLEFMAFDPEKMKRVFINLIENSLEAMESVAIKEIEISVMHSTENSSDSLYFFYFSDSGKGISSEDWQSVFSSKYTTKQDHSGLGLSIVKKIIEDHGGRISITEGKKHKTTFLIELPKIKL